MAGDHVAVPVTAAGARALGVSLLRTFVSWAWALVIGWVIVVFPPFEPFRDALLGLSDLALPVLVGVIGAAWYALARKLEPRLPRWLVAALLGSAKAPVYVTDARAAGAVTNTSMVESGASR